MNIPSTSSTSSSQSPSRRMAGPPLSPSPSPPRLRPLRPRRRVGLALLSKPSHRRQWVSASGAGLAVPVSPPMRRSIRAARPVSIT